MCADVGGVCVCADVGGDVDNTTTLLKLPLTRQKSVNVLFLHHLLLHVWYAVGEGTRCNTNQLTN